MQEPVPGTKEQLKLSGVQEASSKVETTGENIRDNPKVAMSATDLLSTVWELELELGGTQMGQMRGMSVLSCQMLLWRNGIPAAEQGAKAGRCKEKQHLPQNCGFCGFHPGCPLLGSEQTLLQLDWVSHPLWHWGGQPVNSATSTYIYPGSSQLSIPR